MLYTLTVNPALDFYVWADLFSLGDINRSNSEELRVGGKGINVSKALRILGVASTVLGFIAGDTGVIVERELERLHIDFKLIRVANGMSRINVKIQADTETAINTHGPALSENDLYALSNQMQEILRPGDTVILSGGIPDSLSDTTYAQLASRLAPGIRFIVDGEGEHLRKTLPYRPLLIKPNLQELGGLFGKVIESEDEIVECGQKLCHEGAQNVLVSRGKDGAILISDNGTILSGTIPAGTEYSTVGAGDAMIGGFIVGYEAGNDMEHALAMGVSAGAASVFSKNGFSMADVMRLLSTVKVSRLQGEHIRCG